MLHQQVSAIQLHKDLLAYHYSSHDGVPHLNHGDAIRDNHGRHDHNRVFQRQAAAGEGGFRHVARAGVGHGLGDRAVGDGFDQVAVSFYHSRAAR